MPSVRPIDPTCPRFWPLLWGAGCFCAVLLASMGVGAAESVPRKIKGADYRIYTADGRRELPHLRGHSYRHTLDLIAEHTQPGRRVLISGAGMKLGRRGTIRVYRDRFGGPGIGYRGLPATIEVEVRRVEGRTVPVLTASWLHYPFIGKPQGAEVLPERPRTSPDALITYLPAGEQKQAWTLAPRRDRPGEHAPRLRELQRFLRHRPAILKRVLRLAADEQAVFDYLHQGDLREQVRGHLEDAGYADDLASAPGPAFTRDEVRLYCRAIRRHTRLNHGTDPFGLGVRPDPLPAPQQLSALLGLPAALQREYLGSAVLPASYAQILGALHQWKVSDVRPVLEELAQRSPTDWSVQTFMAAVLGSWCGAPTNPGGDPLFLVHRLGEGQSRQTGLTRDAEQRLKSLKGSDGAAKLLQALPLLAHFAARATQGRPPLAKLVAKTLVSSRPVADNLAILEACLRNDVLDEHASGLVSVRRPRAVVLEAIETSDQPKVALKALREYGLPDGVALGLAVKRWNTNRRKKPNFEREANRQRGRQFVELVGLLRRAKLLTPDALQTIRLAEQQSVGLDADQISEALGKNSQIEAALTRALFTALQQANPEEIGPREFDRLARGESIDGLHHKRKLLVRWIHHRRRQREAGADSAAPSRSRTAASLADKMTNRVLDTALASDRSNNEIMWLVKTLVPQPAFLAKGLRAAIASAWSPKAIEQLVAQAREYALTQGEIVALLGEDPTSAGEILGHLHGLSHRQRAGTIDRYHKHSLQWHDLARIVENVPALSSQQIALLMAQRMSPDAFAGLRKLPVTQQRRLVAALLHERLRGAPKETRKRLILQVQSKYGLRADADGADQLRPSRRGPVAPPVMAEARPSRPSKPKVSADPSPIEAAGPEGEKPAEPARRSQFAASEPRITPEDKADDILDVLYHRDLLVDLRRTEDRLYGIQSAGQTGVKAWMLAILEGVSVGTRGPLTQDQLSILSAQSLGRLHRNRNVWDFWHEAGRSLGRSTMAGLWSLGLPTPNGEAWASYLRVLEMLPPLSGSSVGQMAAALSRHDRLGQGRLLREVARLVVPDINGDKLLVLGSASFATFFDSLGINPGARNGQPSRQAIRAALLTTIDRQREAFSSLLSN